MGTALDATTIDYCTVLHNSAVIDRPGYGSESFFTLDAQYASAKSLFYRYINLLFHSVNMVAAKHRLAADHITSTARELSGITNIDDFKQP